jgi:molybdopterin-guanine dinucleotide biosynthesis protein A
MGNDKGWTTFRGQPLVQHALGLLEPLCDSLLISANDDRYRSLGHPVVYDKITGAGPLAGLCAALKHSSTRDNLVIPCDMPLLTREMLDYLLCAVRDQIAVIPVHPDGQAEPLCGYYSTEIIPVMEKQLEQGNYKLTDMLREAGAFFLKLDETLPFYDPHIFTNLNTPADLRNVDR